jgi:hypothetical protein
MLPHVAAFDPETDVGRLDIQLMLRAPAGSHTL